MDYSKIAGWVVFLAGILIIGWTLLTSYNIFTAKALLPEFFQMPESQTSVQQTTTQDAQAQLQQMIGEQLKGILPFDSLYKFLNLAVWSMLAFVLIFGGGQIANLGIKLIKK
ncbi:MAG: hypothetical protein PHE52_03320 [Candidatus Pacebacteria bacterium]|nr:hypothetical protein [Candidatus Paceibacterota bacterium]